MTENYGSKKFYNSGPRWELVATYVWLAGAKILIFKDLIFQVLTSWELVGN
jgi:hypothetical protein